MFVSLVVCPCADAAESNPRPKGTNCDLVSPPSDAGEESNHGITLRIYPRAKDVGPGYSGCQVLFAPDGEKWIVVTLTEVVNGDPTRIWGAEPDPRMDCRYEKGQVVKGDPQQCPVPSLLLTKSMEPGCVELLKAAVARDGLGASIPKRCDYR